jgi:hypothetical protein
LQSVEQGRRSVPDLTKQQPLAHAAALNKIGGPGFDPGDGYALTSGTPALPAPQRVGTSRSKIAESDWNTRQIADQEVAGQ